MLGLPRQIVVGQKCIRSHAERTVDVDRRAPRGSRGDSVGETAHPKGREGRKGQGPPEKASTSHGEPRFSSRDVHGLQRPIVALVTDRNFPVGSSLAAIAAGSNIRL